jgi:glycine/D-amino acid oxidase-like deaminating enzyme
MKPSWFASLGADVYKPAIAKLAELYPLQEVGFYTGPVKTTTVTWINPQEILRVRKLTAHVERLARNGKRWQLLIEGEPVEARIVIVAAGIWTGRLVPEVQQRGLAGMAFLWPKETIGRPFIRPWMPYKQIVAFNRGDGLWAGDGSAILWKNWTVGHADRSLQRCRGALKRRLAPPIQIFGVRPYHDAKPCYLSEIRPNLWVATGGAKNGTLAAGWCAHELSRRL